MRLDKFATERLVVFAEEQEAYAVRTQSQIDRMQKEVNKARHKAAKARSIINAREKQSEQVG